jgi:hypothetical protein
MGRGLPQEVIEKAKQEVSLDSNDVSVAKCQIIFQHRISLHLSSSTSPNGSALRIRPVGSAT